MQNATGAAATLCGWIDFDTNGQGGQTGDGAFSADEGSCITIPASGGNASCTASGTTFTCSITWTVPADSPRRREHQLCPLPALERRTYHQQLQRLRLSELEPGRGGGLLHWFPFPGHTRCGRVGGREWADGRSLATATETSNAVFRIWGLNTRGERFLLSKVKSNETDSFSPQRYEVAVPAADLTAIEIEDVSTR